MTDIVKIIRAAIEGHEPQFHDTQWYVDDNVIDCDARYFRETARRAVELAELNNRQNENIQGQIRAAVNIQPNGSRKITINEDLSHENRGVVLMLALDAFPDAPVIVIDAPNGSTYYMNTADTPPRSEGRR